MRGDDREELREVRWDLGAGAAEHLGVRGDQERLADGGEPAMMMAMAIYPSATRP